LGAKVSNNVPVPDIRLIDRPTSSERTSPPPVLQPFPERKTVLLVDDETSVLGALMRALAQENYDLIPAESGAIALQKVDDLGRPIDLLITDYQMPGMNGRELAVELWRRDLLRKALYETGFTDQLFASRIELERNAAFIEKPFSARGLVEAARLLLFGSINPTGAAGTA
jgi:response regulator RpfG family c-di-GMP phosphodiesterase